MKPGREFDALVEEKVMRRDVGDIYYDATRQEIMGTVRRYSTDIAASWEIVEKMNSMEFYLELFQFDINGLSWSAQFIHPAKLEHKCVSETPSHAICMAALRALGIEQ